VHEGDAHRHDSSPFRVSAEREPKWCTIVTVSVTIAHNFGEILLTGIVVEAIPGQVGAGPVYRELGRMSLAAAACSTMWAHQPTDRLTAKVGVNIVRGSPAVSITTPA
jgi:hypothetical protein